MNLLTDPWIPILHDRGLERVRYREFLCGKRALQVSYPRDDMEFAALQLLICLTQVFFAPDNREQWRHRLDNTLKEAEFEDRTRDREDYFDLKHPQTPFMQTRGVEAKKVTTVQKLFAGMLSGPHNTFFNRPDDIPCCCGPCAAVALFNQAANTPSFGGSFMGTLRGGAPLSTLVGGDDSRKTVWLNVLCKDRLPPLRSGGLDDLVWIRSLKRESTIQAPLIGWERGLFWQPAYIELLWSDQPVICPACGQEVAEFVRGLKTNKYRYFIKGIWPHPHGPRRWKKSGNAVSDFFASFTSTSPCWTQLTEMLVNIEDEKEGSTPAAVVIQFRDLCRGQPLQLMVGGYRNKEPGKKGGATIRERRHEQISVSRGWQDNLPHLRHIIELALEVREALIGNIVAFANEIKSKPDKIDIALRSRAQALYYQQSESIVHRTLRLIDWREIVSAQENFVRQLTAIAVGVFDQVTAPYSHSMKMIRSLVKARRGLEGALHKLIRQASEAST